MDKKFKASEIHLKIDNTIPFYNDNFAGLIIEWNSLTRYTSRLIAFS